MAPLLLKHFLTKLSIFYNFCFDHRARFVIKMSNYEKIISPGCPESFFVRKS